MRRKQKNWYLLVSILVLLEPPLILVGIDFRDNTVNRFNPCFTGTSSHTSILPAIKITWLGFNPCFTGTSSHTCRNNQLLFLSVDVSILVLLEPPLIHKSSSIVIVSSSFQSLFYWNLLSYLMLSTLTMSFKNVSILVLLEPPLILGTSLSHCLWVKSFNPCFTGTSSHTK